MKLLRVLSLIIFLCLNAVTIFSQKNKPGEAYYAYDAAWKPLNNIKKAIYFARVKKVNDTCWVVNNYNMFGPMISREVYKDRENKIAHGTWIFYKPDGYMDSVCNFQNALAHGKWYFLNDTGRTYREKNT